MLIAGARGHALEILAVLHENKYAGKVFFFDDVNEIPDGAMVLGKYPVINSEGKLGSIFIEDASFIIGVGGTGSRQIISDKLIQHGGVMQSVISQSAFVGIENILLGDGINIMPGAVITTNTFIGKGTLIHVHCSIHHDTVIGEYCELSPGCRILGNVKIGNQVTVGAGAIILPHVSIGDNAVVGAGAVVIKNVLPAQTVAGVPAKAIK